jgi:MATE family multidrug resistance protein
MDQSSNLTKARPGSIREVFIISLPLILTSLSEHLMLFLDRLILSHYSIEAMDASAAAGMSSWLFISVVFEIAMIVEIFVGQYNGSRQDDKLVSSVWQMLWVSIGASFFFIPIGLYGGETFLPYGLERHGVPYFKILTVFGSIPCVIVAVSAFFIGRGKMKLVAWVVVAMNIFNAILDYFLVFGIEGWLYPMGTAGAALATVIATSIQAVILLSVFLNRRHAERFNTRKMTFNLKLTKKCLKIGWPSSVASGLETLAWVAFYHVAAFASPVHVTVLAVGQSILFMFVAANNGIKRGITAVASNYIGGRQKEIINKVLKSSLSIHCISIILIAIPLLAFPTTLVDWFLPDTSMQYDIAFLEKEATQTLLWVWILLLCEGTFWVYASILIVGGDTFFVMLLNTIAPWFSGLLPLYIGLIYFHSPPSSVWFFGALYVFVITLIAMYHYYSDKWLKLDLSQQG